MVNEDVNVIDGTIAYEMRHEIIEHAGDWQAQLVYEQDKDGVPEKYTSKVVSFGVSGHLLDTKEPALVAIENWNNFVLSAESLIEDWEQNEAVRQDNELVRQSQEESREIAETARQEVYDDLIDAGVMQENINQKLAESEAEYAPRLTELEQNDADLTAQLAQTDGRVDNLVLEYDIDPNKDPEIIDARKSVNTGITYDLLGQRINELEAVQMLGGELMPTDYSGTPGGKVILKGNREYGFLGFVQPEEMGKLLDNPEDNQEFNGVNLAAAVGITQGTAINSNTPWMKFFSGNDIIFVPVKPIRHSTTWNSTYNAGAVYGDGTIGVNPPNGRAGNKLSVDGANSSFLIEPSATDEGFLKSGAVIASAGDTIVARGFANEENNGEFVISEITDTSIKVNATLFTEPKGRNSASIYKKGDEVAQDAEVTVGRHKYKVRLLKGASQDPLNSYSDSDRDLVGPASEWNNLVLPLHERAKVGDWNYKSYAGDVEDWGIGLTDETLVTHHTVGEGSYRWMQETGDGHPSRRVYRGYFGASYGGVYYSWYSITFGGWAPALLLIS